MRLHSLELQAFGPFPGHHAIDFDALAGAGLHLIHGPTGAGKTSILDAICFALFNDVPGQRKGMGSVACALAAADVRPHVELVVTLAGRRLRIRRSPAYERPKRRGAGTTTEKMSVHLWEWIGGEWHAVSNRVEAVADLIAEELGLSLAQFAQVVLLPQGDFSRFLHAGADERDALLRTLFDIERFVDLEKWFVGERDRMRTESARVEKPVGDAATRFQQLIDATADLEPSGDEPRAPLMEAQDPMAEASILAQRMHEAAEQAQVAESAAQDAEQRAAVALREAEELDGRQLRGRRALESAGQLAASADEAEDRRRELAAAQRAARVVPTVRQAEQDAADAQAAADKVAAGRPARFGSDAPGQGRESSVGADAAPSEAVTAALATERLSATEHLLDQAVGEQAALAHQVKDAVRQARSAAAAMELRDAAGSEHRARTEHLEALLRQQEVAGASVPDVATAQEQHRVLTDVHERFGEVDRLAPPARRERDALEAAVAAFTTARATLDDVRRARAADVLADLSEQLTPGEPCGVCGATEHPAPARRAMSVATEAQVTEAAQAEARAAKQVEAARRAERETSNHVRDAAATLAERLDQAGLGRYAVGGLTSALLGAGPGGDSDGDELSDDDAVAAFLPGLAPSQNDTVDLPAVRDRLRRRSMTAQADLAAARRAAQEQQRLTLALAAAQDRVRDCGTDLARAEAAVVSQVASAGDAVTSAELLTRTLRSLLADHAQQCPCVGPGDTERLDAVADLPHAQQNDGADLADVPLEGEATVEVRLEALTRSANALDAAATRALTGHRSLQRQVQAWLQATQEHARALAAADRSADHASALLAAETFADADQARRASRSAARRAELTDAVDERARAEARTAAVLDEPAVQAAMRLDAPDLPARRSEHEAARKATRTAHARTDRSRRVADTMVSEARRWAAALERAAPVRARAAEVEQLAALVGGAGANETRMRLSAYVLSAKLELVVSLANVRLATMTDGRFTLLHDDGPARRGRRGGLGLEVVDAWTGQTRPTATLSGGETFMASLALALGLADAVQADAGGRAIETLFVDEGFGTLDDQSLEQVLTVLDDLRAGGRTVGVVSHVAELRDRIPARIEVFKSDTGSRLEVRTPGAAAVA